MSKFNTDYILEDSAVQGVNFPFYYLLNDKRRRGYTLKLNDIEENKKILSLEQDIIALHKDYKNSKKNSTLNNLFRKIKKGENTINTLVEDKNAKKAIRLIADTIGKICIENYTNDVFVQEIFEIFHIGYRYNGKLKVYLAYLRKNSKKVYSCGLENGTLIIKNTKGIVTLEVTDSPYSHYLFQLKLHGN